MNDLTLVPAGPYSAGQAFTINGAGWDAGDVVTVTVAGAAAGTPTVDPGGTFAVQAAAPLVAGPFAVVAGVAEKTTVNAAVQGAGALTLGPLVLVLDADNKTVHAAVQATADVLNVTLDEPLGTKVVEAAPDSTGHVVFPPFTRTPGVHTMTARGWNVPAHSTGGQHTNTPSAQVTIPGVGPTPPPVGPWFGGKRLYASSPGYLGASAPWVTQNANASKALGSVAVRTDIASMAMADVIIPACRAVGQKVIAILGGSVASISPTLGPAIIAKYHDDLAAIETPNEPQTRISVPNFARLLHDCVPPCQNKGIPVMIGALNNSQGGSITPAAHPWEWWSALWTEYVNAYHEPVPGDILSWHWYLSWPGEAANLVAVERSHGMVRPTFISETGISTYQGTQTYQAQAAGLVADLKTQLADPNVIGYALFQPFDMHAGDGQFANNLGVMGKPAQAAVAAAAAQLRTAGVIL